MSDGQTENHQPTWFGVRLTGRKCPILETRKDGPEVSFWSVEPRHTGSYISKIRFFEQAVCFWFSSLHCCLLLPECGVAPDISQVNADRSRGRGMSAWDFCEDFFMGISASDPKTRSSQLWPASCLLKIWSSPQNWSP